MGESANGENWGPAPPRGCEEWDGGKGNFEVKEFSSPSAGLRYKDGRLVLGVLGLGRSPGSEQKAPNGETCGLELKYPAIRVFEGVKFHVVAGRETAGDVE